MVVDVSVYGTELVMLLSTAKNECNRTGKTEGERNVRVLTLITLSHRL